MLSLVRGSSGPALRALTVTATCAGALICAALPAVADPGVHARTSPTPDGGVTVRLSHDEVTSVPPLTAIAFSHEGFVTLDASGVAAGPAARWIGAHLVTGYQVACGTNVGGGISLGFGSSGGPTIGWNNGPEATINGTVGPTVGVQLQPGVVTDVVMGDKRVGGATVGLTVDQIHLEADGCLGPVAVRPYATYTASTATADHTVAVYGRPRQL